MRLKLSIFNQMMQNNPFYCSIKAKFTLIHQYTLGTIDFRSWQGVIKWEIARLWHFSSHDAKEEKHKFVETTRFFEVSSIDPNDSAPFNTLEKHQHSCSCSGCL